MQDLEIFRAGRHTDNRGRTLTFSEADLDGVVAAYDPAKHEAPLVVGHPRHDAPAYGWVASVRRREAHLDATPRQVDGTFAESVRAGRFKKLSASFYLPDAHGNPAPGSYYLRHVGFLGAMPPAVKGLSPVELAEDEAGVVEFSEWGDRENAGLWRGLREWILTRFGAEDADRAVPGYAVETVAEAARPPSPPLEIQPAATGYAETNIEEDAMQLTLTQEQLQARIDQAVAAALGDREAQFSERENALAELEATARRKDTADFVEALVAEGRLLPADQPGLVACLAGDATVCFTEGDAATTEPAGAWLRGWLGRLPKQVEYAELGGGALPGDAGAPDPEAVARRAVAYQEEQHQHGVFVSTRDAVRHVTDNPA